MGITNTSIKVIAVAFVLMFFCGVSRAQLIYQPYSFQFNQQMDRQIYNPATRLHTSLKPFLISDSSSLRPAYDSLMNRGIDTSKHKGWILRKLFNEHLIDVKNKEYTFYADYLPDLQIGRDFSGKTSTWLNTRGYQVGGTIGTNFFFYSSGFENQGKFPTYLNNYVLATGMVPGQAFDFNRGVGNKDWLYVTTLIGYTASKNFTIEAGVDKTFIGDGYRSMLLSDFASNYPLLRLRVNLGKNVQYMAMWAYLQDQSSPKLDPANAHAPNRIKWGAFHYIDWNITNRASLGFFNALIVPDAYDNGTGHGFDANFVNPILFLKSIAPNGPIPDNTWIGFNGKYKVFDKTTVYAQLLLDQSGTSANSKQGFQIGVRGADLFKVNSFNYLFEYNTAKPYTYASQYPLVNYADLSEPLAHPFGANFNEVLGILNYSLGKFDFQAEVNYAKYGLDQGGLNYGKNILLAETSSQGDQTRQGLRTDFKYAEGKISYIINPKYNLRLEAGAVFREESNSQYNNKTMLFTFGLRSTFRNLYTDF